MRWSPAFTISLVLSLFVWAFIAKLVWKVVT